MRTTVPIRLAEGLYEAVSEIAGTIGMDKSSAAGLLLSAGLEQVRDGFFSAKTTMLMQADTHAAKADFLRSWAKVPEEKKSEIEEQLGELFKKLLRVFKPETLE